MKNLHKVNTAILIGAIICSTVSVADTETIIDGWHCTYSCGDGTGQAALLYRGGAIITNIFEVPEYINHDPVRYIAKGAFADSPQLNTLVFPLKSSVYTQISLF